MSRIVIISNRLPITIDRIKKGFSYHPSSGGLATGLNSLDDSLERIWIGWPGKAIKQEKEKVSIQKNLKKQKLIPVFLTEQEIEYYYEGFCNDTIWPHFHYFSQYTTYRDDYWSCYQSVNQKFADVVSQHLRKDDIVWVHDYQLLLLPALIRASFPNISIGFFLHIPFPSYEVFRILPWRAEILNGVLGADQIGFHTFGYMRHFLSAVYRIAGYEHHFGRLTVGSRMVNVDVFPMGIDYNTYAYPETDMFVDDGTLVIRQLAKSQRLVLSIDRLDYTKGIPQRLEVFTKFIKENPAYLEKVVLVLIVIPSRSNVETYQELKHQIDTLVGEINSTYGTFAWTPVRYFYRSLSFSELTVLYEVADIAMITPLRDGMNLVAKEYVASKETSKKGVLILSEMAGAADELTEALIVNPQDANDMVAKLVQALEMNLMEQRWRIEKMQEHLKIYDVRNWANAFIQEQVKLMEIQDHDSIQPLNTPEKTALLEAYQAAEKRLIILDYDGTLMDFHADPQAVVPDEDLLAIMKKLQADSKNKLVVNSGRDKTTMEEWLGPLGIDLAAEHGVWLKRDEIWEVAPGLFNTWKPQLRTALENMVKRTPGSFIEEKDYSLVWHYRMIDRDLGEKRVREFREVLAYLTHNLDLQVLEGNKVVEIKNSGVNKGNVTASWVAEDNWDFILAIGDDHTDEDTFNALPEHGYSVKVGMMQTAARFNVPSVEAVRELLTDLGNIE